MNEYDILNSVLFYGIAFLMIIFSMMCIFSKKIIYAMICAIIVFLASSGLFFLLQADYNAVIQIAIYAIAVPIMFIFAIMFTNNDDDTSIYLSIKPRLWFSIFSGGLLLLSLIYIAATTISITQGSHWLMSTDLPQINKYQMFSALATGIFNDYGFSFILISILFFVVIIGISTLDLQKNKGDKND